MGLDYHYDLSPREVQREVFRRQLAWAEGIGMPVVLHVREAMEDALAILRGKLTDFVHQPFLSWGEIRQIPSP